MIMDIKASATGVLQKWGICTKFEHWEFWSTFVLIWTFVLLISHLRKAPKHYLQAGEKKYNTKNWMDKRIYIKDWLELKPYGNQTVTDSYYLKICNEIKKVITTNKQSFVLQRYLDNEDINLLSCFLTSYFEDLLSETNIWNSFVRTHQRLYRKQLPFYNLDEYY